LRQYLPLGEELILTDTLQPVAKVIFFNHENPQKSPKKAFRVREIDLGEDVTINREQLYDQEICH
jgi:antitoxin (DNA-binding transcriptional repressor) of toxin-antitoxin stability system